MGLACRIHRLDNKTKDIVVVEAPNGEESILYNDLVQHFEGDKEKALNFWTLPYTDSFKEINGQWEQVDKVGIHLELDTNGEPLIKNVLSFYEGVKYQDKKLTNQQLAELSNNFYTLPINNIEELYTKLRLAFYSEGIFTIDKSLLESSGLYSDIEILNIIGDKSLQGKLKDFVARIENDYFSDDPKLGGIINSTEFDDMDIIIDTSEVLGLGKYRVINPNEVSSDIGNIVGGIKDRDFFNDAIQAIPYESFKSRFNEDASFALRVFERYSAMKSIPRLKEVGNTLEGKEVNDRVTEMKETLLVNTDTTSLKDDLDFIQGIPSDVWEDSSVEITSLLKSMEDKLVKLNIDVIGLHNSIGFKNQDEILSFVTILENFIGKLDNNNVEDSDISNLVEVIRDILGEEISFETIVDVVSEANDNKILFDMPSDKSDSELFEQHSLIRTQEGYLHKVEVIEDKNQLYNTLYGLILQDNSILPKEAYYPSAYKLDNTFSIEKLRDTTNQGEVLRNIKTFINKKVAENKSLEEKASNDTLEKMMVYKYAFKHPTSNLIELDVKDEYSKYKSFKGNFEYLTTGFIADFFQEILVHKAKDSSLYRNVLRHFVVTDQGIVLRNKDAHTLQQIRLLSPNTKVFNNLKQYTLISKDSSMTNLYERGVELEIEDSDISFHRALYNLQPNLLSLTVGEFVSDKGVIVVDNFTDNFIRTPEGVFERVGEQGNLGIYALLPSVKSVTYNNYKFIPKPTQVRNIDKFKNYSTFKEGNFVVNTVLYNRKESERIDDQIDKCS